MVKLKNKNSGGTIHVTDEYAETMLALGTWVRADAPVKEEAPAAPKRRGRPKKVAVPEEN